MSRHVSISAFGLGLAVLGAAASASAHISVERAGVHESRYGDADIKDAPCGRAGGARGSNVYTYAPGETITLSLVEYIPHPGYYRIAFDDDGDDDFVDPQSIKPVDPARGCPSSPTDRCGESDFYNTPAVLMDNLDPHVTAAFDAEYSWDVTLPDVECDNCTLQVIQVMEDDLFHGPYDPTPGVGIADIYHQCIDLVLKAGDPPAGGGDAGDDDHDDGDHDHDDDAKGDDGGCTVAAGAPMRSSSLAALGIALGALLARRRRR
jgi:hypothetical protein